MYSVMAMHIEDDMIFEKGRDTRNDIKYFTTHAMSSVLNV